MPSFLCLLSKMKLRSTKLNHRDSQHYVAVSGCKCAYVCLLGWIKIVLVSNNVVGQDWTKRHLTAQPHSAHHRWNAPPAAASDLHLHSSAAAAAAVAANVQKRTWYTWGQVKCHLHCRSVWVRKSLCTRLYFWFHRQIRITFNGILNVINSLWRLVVVHNTSEMTSFCLIFQLRLISGANNASVVMPLKLFSNLLMLNFVYASTEISVIKYYDVHWTFLRRKVFYCKYTCWRNALHVCWTR